MMIYFKLLSILLSLFLSFYIYMPLSTAKTAHPVNRINPLLDVGDEEPTNTNKNIKGRPTIALALGGGGMRGAAHIGVLRVLEKENIPIDYVAGCSMGAIIGGLYCAGVPLDEIEQALLDKSLQRAYAPGWVIGKLLLCPFKSLTCKCTFKDKPYAGLFNGRKFLAFIDEKLPKDKKRIEDTNIPFVAVCTNLIDGKAYKLAKGDLSQAILASSAFPPIVRPVDIDGNLYIDGAVRSNVPVVSAKQFGADIVIAVSADAAIDKVSAKKFTSVKNVANRITDIIISVADKYHLQKADLSIIPNVTDIPIYSKKVSYVKPAVKAGEDAANKSLPEIKQAIAKAQLKISNN